MFPKDKMKTDHGNENDPSPLYHLTGGYNVRIQEYEMSQNLIAPAAWALAIMRHKPAMVIEIGTDKGGFSNLLSSFVASYGGEFHTMDIKIGGDTLKYPLYGNATFHQWDCFKNYRGVEALICKPGLCFVLCDGGDKKAEFALFSEYLKDGDVIAAHDWIDETVPNYAPNYWGWCETQTKDLQPAIAKHGLVDFMPEWFQFSAWCVKQKP